MAAYAALASLSHTTNPTKNQHSSFFSIVAEENIRSIHDLVIFMLSFLEDFPEKAKRWEGKMRDIAHETEDIIEQFIWQQSYNRWIKLSTANNFEEQLRNVVEKFCLIVGDVMDERPAYTPLVVSSSSSSSRVAATGDVAVVGLDEDLMAMKDRVCGLSSKLQVIPIVGMGGIGKTTLARMVYEDSLIVRYFDIRVWLTISQDYSAHKTLLSLLDSMKFIEQMPRQIDDCEMKEKVYKNLKGRRYLIVMDDVWNTKVWDDVRNIFPDDGNGSRIMLTTRLSDLASYPGSNSLPHEMKFMTDSQSWDLLKQEVLGNGHCPPELEDAGKEIARSCVGLPLAVVLVAGFLSAVDRTPSCWKEIAKNVNLIVGEELEGILTLSYTHLPHHLRPCFLFIGVFPEDESIRVSKLIRLWLAEGFLKHDNGCSKSLEEVAEEYLEDLVKRNLVMVTSRKSDGKIKRCGLHDTVRELCIRKAREEKFLWVVDGCAVPQDMIIERHISFRKSNIDNIWGPTIRTILCFQLQNFPSSPSFLLRFRLLRLLDAVDDNFNEPPLQVFELFQLRYLALVCSSVIPSSISNLMNLQTLIILPKGSPEWKRSWGVNTDICHFSLPLEIWRMSQLRHIILYDLYMLPHPPDGSNLPLENLQTLSHIKNLVWTENIIQMIPNIKRLELVYEINEEFNLHLLKHLNQLVKLEVQSLHSFSWMGRYPTFPRTLKKLTLVGGSFPWKNMSIIGSLPNLEVLKLRHSACSGETWETAEGEFLQLRFLLIKGSSLQHWITESSHFPRLERLVLRSCHYLEEIPEGIGHIPTLELIQVVFCYNSLEKSALQIGEDQLSYGNTLRVCVSRYNEVSQRRTRYRH